MVLILGCGNGVLWKLGRHLPDLRCCNKMMYAGIRRRKGVTIICIVGVDMSSKT